jgi:hypothetical protein
LPEKGFRAERLPVARLDFFALPYSRWPGEELAKLLYRYAARTMM